MKTIAKIAGIALCVLVLPLSANASIIFMAEMNSAGETVPNGSLATGTAMVTLHDDMDTLDVFETFSGLTAPAAAAHIHCCAAQGLNAAVRIGFGGFPAATSGTFSQTYTLSSLALGGMSAADFLAGLNAGLAYVNIHNSVYPGGEIRGQLVKVPEPASVALFGLGLLGLGFVTRKRASSAA